MSRSLVHLPEAAARPGGPGLCPASSGGTCPGEDLRPGPPQAVGSARASPPLLPRGLRPRSHCARGQLHVTDTFRSRSHHSGATVSLSPAHRGAGAVDASPRPLMPRAQLSLPALPRPPWDQALAGAHLPRPCCSAPAEARTGPEQQLQTPPCPQHCQGDHGPVQSHPTKGSPQGRWGHPPQQWRGHPPTASFPKGSSPPLRVPRWQNEVGGVLGVWKGPVARCRTSPFL